MSVHPGSDHAVHACKSCVHELIDPRCTAAPDGRDTPGGGSRIAARRDDPGPIPAGRVPDLPLSSSGYSSAGVWGSVARLRLSCVHTRKTFSVCLVHGKAGSAMCQARRGWMGRWETSARLLAATTFTARDSRQEVFEIDFICLFVVLLHSRVSHLAGGRSLSVCHIYILYIIINAAQVMRRHAVVTISCFLLASLLSCFVFLSFPEPPNAMLRRRRC